MVYQAVLISLVILPFLLITILKANGAVAFLSVCLGSVLATIVAPDATDVITAVTRGSELTTLQWVQVALLTVPLLVSVFFTRRSVRKGGKLVLNWVNALAASCLFAVLMVQYLPSGVQTELQHVMLWRQLNNLETTVLIVGSITSLLFFLLSRPHENHDKKHGK